MGSDDRPCALHRQIGMRKPVQGCLSLDFEDLSIKKTTAVSVPRVK
jgi:hypothetical protein